MQTAIQVSLIAGAYREGGTAVGLAERKNDSLAPISDIQASPVHLTNRPGDIEAMLYFLDTTAETNDHRPPSDLVEEESLFSVFDSVYQGSRRGDLEQTAGLLYVTERMLLTGPRNFPAACVAQSFPKNVGPYRVLSTNNKEEMPSIKNSTVVIFGGSSGIGYGVADKCLSEGAIVHISSSNATRITQAVSSLKEKYPAGQVTGHTCDLSLPDVEQRLVKLFEEIGSCDHIVYTAGDALAVRPLKDLDLQSIQKAGHIRFDVPLLVAKLALSVLKPGYTSSLILTGGVVGDRPQPNWAVIAGYSAGLYGMVPGLALDMKPLRVNFVSPGPVKTGMFPDEVAEMLAKRTTLGKVGSVEEVAEAYVYLMKDTNATGSCVSTNSGSLLM
ncbi:hypothetical protein CNMCM5878_002128 [Aspergillus fumigatiaffinis]|nr:hypothetical protein CNMCM5878_002128 [Aspergillus fumigatiaffinis]